MGKKTIAIPTLKLDPDAPELWTQLPGKISIPSERDYHGTKIRITTTECLINLNPFADGSPVVIAPSPPSQSPSPDRVTSVPLSTEISDTDSKLPSPKKSMAIEPGFERAALLKWLQEKSTHPTTRQKCVSSDGDLRWIRLLNWKENKEEEWRQVHGNSDQTGSPQDGAIWVLDSPDSNPDAFHSVISLYNPESPVYYFELRLTPDLHHTASRRRSASSADPFVCYENWSSSPRGNVTATAKTVRQKQGNTFHFTNFEYDKRSGILTADQIIARMKSGSAHVIHMYRYNTDGSITCRRRDTRLSDGTFIEMHLYRESLLGIISSGMTTVYSPDGNKTVFHKFEQQPNLTQKAAVVDLWKPATKQFRSFLKWNSSEPSADAIIFPESTRIEDLSEMARSGSPGLYR